MLNEILREASEITLEDFIPHKRLHVPILYKLGRTKEASELAQRLFEADFPELHAAIESKLQSLFGKEYRETTVAQHFGAHPFTTRVKSTYSVFRKLPHLEITRAEFAAHVKDFVGVRCTIPCAHNAYDALLEGLCRAPLQGLRSFRNQMLPQAHGFDGEPVMKLCYVFDGFPIELQILEGAIENFLCAKGYSSYKAQLPLPPTQEALSPDLWQRRLTMALTLAPSAFQQVMLDELH